MHILKLVEAGESLAVVLPQDVLERLKLSDGDEVLLEETDGGFSLVKPMRPEQNAGAQLIFASLGNCSKTTCWMNSVQRPQSNHQ